MTASGTSEAGYIALSEVAKEVILLRQAQVFMDPLMRILHNSDTPLPSELPTSVMESLWEGRSYTGELMPC